MKKVGKKAPFVLASMLFINTFSGCAIQQVSEETVKKESDDYSTNVFTDFEIVEKSSAITLEDGTLYGKQEVLDALSNYYNFANRDYSDILSAYAKETDRQIYAAGLYGKLKSFGLSDEIIIKELTKLMEITNSQSCVSKGVEIELLPNLSSTVKEDAFVTEEYYPLAKFLHINTCQENHTGIGDHIFCEAIYQKEESKKIAKKMEAVLSTCDDKQVHIAFNRIKNKANLQDYLDELEYVYAFGAIPTDSLGADYKTYFKNLQSTMNKRENVFDVYYPLAVIVHEYNCNLEHETNEYFCVTCENVAYILKYEP